MRCRDVTAVMATRTEVAGAPLNCRVRACPPATRTRRSCGVGSQPWAPWKSRDLMNGPSARTSIQWPLAEGNPVDRPAAGTRNSTSPPVGCAVRHRLARRQRGSPPLPCGASFTSYSLLGAASAAALPAARHSCGECLRRLFHHRKLVRDIPAEVRTAIALIGSRTAGTQTDQAPPSSAAAVRPEIRMSPPPQPIIHLHGPGNVRGLAQAPTAYCSSRALHAERGIIRAPRSGRIPSIASWRSLSSTACPPCSSPTVRPPSPPSPALPARRCAPWAQRCRGRGRS